MKTGRPSRTAQFVALGRAIADAGLSHVPEFHDPTAQAFLTEGGKKSLAKRIQAAAKTRRGFGARLALELAGNIALRTFAIDTAVRSAIAGGAAQLVILGAGYDGRAWRMPELADVTVFEVDHPTTQDDKRARTRALPPTKAAVTFVPIDFGRESLETALDRAGHDRSRLTCWIWEGVVMYLTQNAMRTTLAHIAARSAPGSTLIVNYHTVHRRLLARLAYWLIGEPQPSAWTPEEMAAELGTIGFAVREDSGMINWNNQFAQGKGNVTRAYYMRVAVARLER